MTTTTAEHTVLAPDEGMRLQSGPGRDLVFKVTGEDTGGAFDYFTVEVAPKGGPPLHVHHKQEETIHVLKGRFKVRIGEEIFELDEGGFAYLPSKVPHAFLNLTDAAGRDHRGVHARRRAPVLRRAGTGHPERDTRPSGRCSDLREARHVAAGAATERRLISLAPNDDHPRKRVVPPPAGQARPLPRLTGGLAAKALTERKGRKAGVGTWPHLARVPFRGPSKLAAARPLRRADSSQRLPMPRVWHTLAEPDQQAVVLGESGRSDEQSNTDVAQTRQNLGREDLGVGPREALRPRTVRASVAKRAAVPRQRSIDAASK